MDNTAFNILVIVLASFLAIFLILAIAASVFAIKILRSLKRITDKAEKLASSAEAVGEFFQQTAEKTAILRLVNNVVRAVKKHESKNKE